MSLISVVSVKKYFGSETTLVKAVDDVSLKINSGQFVAITGKSGSGKSTLLYLLGLLDEPSSGEVFFNNINIANTNQNKRRKLRLSEIGYVFQDYSLMPSLSAIDNVRLPLIMQGYSAIKAKEISENALNQVDLKNRYHYYPSQLSGGEKQRVGIARAIAKKPKVIIADEPTANLDSKTSKDIMNLFLVLNKGGQTIVMVTHEQDYAKLATVRYTMKDGKLK